MDADGRELVKSRSVTPPVVTAASMTGTRNGGNRDKLELKWVQTQVTRLVAKSLNKQKSSVINPKYTQSTKYQISSRRARINSDRRYKHTKPGAQPILYRNKDTFIDLQAVR